MNSTQLECFVHVAQNLNFRRAADDLHISQPAVTKHVASLEAELGGPLFARSTRTVALTELGESFLPDAKEILQLVSNASEKASRITYGGGLIIGYHDAGQLYTIAKVLKEFHKSHPNTRISLKQGPRGDLEELLEKGNIDAIFGFYAESFITGKVVFNKLLDDELVFVANKDSKFANYKEIQASDLVNEHQIICIPASLRRRSEKIRKAIPEAAGSETIYCETTPDALTLVAAGLGFTLIPTVSTPTNSELTVVKWNGDYQSIYGIYSNNAFKSQILDQFIECAARVLKR